MQRRNLIKLATVMPLAVLALPLREVRQALEIGGETHVHIIVTAHATAKDAERYRQQWIGQPFETYGEWYVQSSEVRSLPDDLAALPGSMSYHDYLFGEAAEELSILVGAFRRGRIAFIIRSQGDGENTVISIADWMASQPTATPGHLAWNDTPLLSLIPDSDDLGTDVEPSTSFWP